MKNGGVVDGGSGERKYYLTASKYLLNQVLRNLALPWSHYYFSQKAISLWQRVCAGKITDKFYKDRVNCKSGVSDHIMKFKGNSSEFNDYEINPNGDWFSYRQVFHDEHMTTINDIIGELSKLDDPTTEEISKILDRIYICRMLKTEDRIPKRQKTRGLDLGKIIEMYKSCGIEVINYELLPDDLKSFRSEYALGGFLIETQEE